MNADPIRVLLIEDDPVDVLLLKESLAEADSSRIKLAYAGDLSAGVELAAEGAFDIILLDINLPDSRGLPTLANLHTQAPQIPIVVLTGLGDEALAVKALQAGAQDYLVKGEISSSLLIRSIRYAIERQRLRNELEISKQREQEARELASLNRISNASQISVTEQAFGVLSLRESAPQFFDRLVENFEQIMDQALEQRVVRVEHHIENELRNMAEQLGSVKGGPRDVIDIYMRALKALSQNVPPQKAQAYAEEGRLAVLGLMGNLVSFYRKYYSGSNRNQTTEIDPQHKGE